MKRRGELEIGLVALMLGGGIGFALVGGAMLKCSTSPSDEIEACGKVCGTRPMSVKPTVYDSMGRRLESSVCICGEVKP